MYSVLLWLLGLLILPWYFVYFILTIGNGVYTLYTKFQWLRQVRIPDEIMDAAGKKFMKSLNEEKEQK